MGKKIFKDKDWVETSLENGLASKADATPDGKSVDSAKLEGMNKDELLIESRIDNGFMTKAEFEAAVSNRRNQFAGSGFVSTKPYSDPYVKNIGSDEGLSTHPNSHYKKCLYFGGDSRYGENTYNINGELLYQGGTTGVNPDSSGEIHFPDYDLPTIESDSSRLSKDYKRGELLLLTDTDRELIINGAFDDNINYFSGNRLDLEYDSDNKRMKCSVNSTDYNYVQIFINGAFRYRYIKGCEYILKADITPSKDMLVDVQYFCERDSAVKVIGGETNSIELNIKVTESSRYPVLNFIISDISTDDYLYIDNISIKLKKTELVTTTQDISAGIDIANNNASKFIKADSISRQDLVFLEARHEDVSEKDIVYPYGCTQYRRGDVNGLSGISEGSFIGADTYSLFGDWQKPNDLVGKGYKWSQLSKEDKLKLAKDHRHNLYLDGDKVIQTRYSLRVIKGIGSEWNIETSTNNDNLGLITKLNNNGHTLEHSNNSIPIALVQRRNPGIYHPVYNPEGCALIYNSGAKKWYEAKDDDGNEIITSLVDCFNTDNIAVINKDDDSDAASLTSLNNGDVSSDTYKKTGYLESNKSGRPDGLLVDVVDEVDVEDLRMDAKKITDPQDFLDKTFANILINNFRGKENTTSIYVHPKKFKCVSNHYIDSAHSSFMVRELDGSEINYYNTADTSKAERIIIIGSYGNSIDLTIGSNRDIQWPHSNNGGSVYLYISNGRKYSRSGNHDMPFKSGEILTLIIVNKRDYKMNNKSLQCDIIGDPRQLKDRVKLEVTSDDITTNITKGEYILCSDGTKNSGSEGHHYLALNDITNIHTNSDDGDANANDGHIDFSDEDFWKDLGDNGTEAGYPKEWLENGIFGSPLLVGENDEDLTPIRGYFNGSIDAYSRSDIGYSHNSNALYFKLFKKGERIHEVVVMGNNNKIVKYNEGNWGIDLSAEGGGNTFGIDNRNHVFINIGNGNTLDELGYDSVEEALAKIIILVFYKTKANVLENHVVKKDVEAFSNFTFGSGYYSNLFASQLLNKPLVGRYSDVSEKHVTTNLTIMSNGPKVLNHPSIRHIESTDIVADNTSHTRNKPYVKFLPYLVSSNRRAQINIIFKEIKYDNEFINQDGTPTNTWGDDNRFHIAGNVHVVNDDNNNKVLFGQKAIKLNKYL